jgi:hypothetical protein
MKVFLTIATDETRIPSRINGVLPKYPFHCLKTFWINLRLASGDYKTRLRLKQL